MEVGEKVIVCGRSARWWDSEIKERIALRRQLYKKVISGRDDLWDEYCRLRREVKDLVREKKLAVWNEIVEKVNVDFDGSRKEFWAFVRRRTKCKKRIIASLKNEAGVSVTSTKGKLEAFQKYYEHLGRVSIDSDFDSNWKELVEWKVSMCGSLSKVCEDEALDREIEKAEIVFVSLKIIRQAVVMA